MFKIRTALSLPFYVVVAASAAVAYVAAMIGDYINPEQ